ncbi:MAG TPA: hypothetical protein VK968_16730 [Roseimicrobium sp.]|nr:hypothetical protein [Roseimicrobium sp.]
MPLSPSTLRKLHRWLGLSFSVSALMASSSGVLHNVMTWTQSPPPAPQPSEARIDPSQFSVPLSAAISSVPGATNGIKAVNLRSIGGKPWYLAYAAGSRTPHYIDATTGKIHPEQDERFAEEIARKHLGGMDVKKTAYLTSYDDEYIAIFRILPVYKFEPGDAKGTRVYVSTMTESVTRLTDNSRQREASIFSNLHKLQFIKSKPLRDGILTLTTFGIFSLSLAGIVLFFMTRPKR